MSYKSHEKFRNIKLLISILDSNNAKKTPYNIITETGVQLADRPKTCSLKNAINAFIDGKLFCLAYIGKMKHKNAFKSCESLNAALPLPLNLKEHNHFIETFKRLEIDRKMDHLSTKIVLDIRRVSQKG